MDWLARLNQQRATIGLGGDASVEILHWAHRDELPDNTPHRHTYFEACLVGGHGAGLYSIGEDARPIGPGDVFVARPGVIHQIVNTQEPWMELFWVAYQVTHTDTAHLPPPMRGFVESDVALTADAGRLVTTVWHTLRAVAPTAGDETLRHLMASLVFTLAEVLSPDHRDAPLHKGRADEAGHAEARQAIRYIHDNLGASLRAGDVAQHVNVSTRHLARLFRRFTGTSLHNYATQARMDRACHLLAHSTLAIKEVGAQVGYPDVHHFTRVFAQKVGRPPGAYRKHHG